MSLLRLCLKAEKVKITIANMLHRVCQTTLSQGFLLYFTPAYIRDGLFYRSNKWGQLFFSESAWKDRHEFVMFHTKTKVLQSESVPYYSRQVNFCQGCVCDILRSIIRLCLLCVFFLLLQ